MNSHAVVSADSHHLAILKSSKREAKRGAESRNQAANLLQSGRAGRAKSNEDNAFDSHDTGSRKERRNGPVSFIEEFSWRVVVRELNCNSSLTNRGFKKHSLAEVESLFEEELLPEETKEEEMLRE